MPIYRLTKMLGQTIAQSALNFLMRSRSWLTLVSHHQTSSSIGVSLQLLFRWLLIAMVLVAGANAPAMAQSGGEKTSTKEKTNE